MIKKRYTLFALAGLVFLVVLRLRGGRRDPPVDGWPVNLAHRGASEMAPENTMEAFRLGIEVGAGGLELDVHLTRDGRLVVIHDPTVDRTTGGTGAVAEMTLDELRALDAGHEFSPDGGATFPYRDRNVRVPTLAEVLRAFPGVVVNVDMKADRPGIEATVLGVLREAGATRRALVVSSSFSAVRRFRKISGGSISTGASRWEVGVFYLFSRLHLERLLLPAYDALQVPPRHRGIPLVTRRFIDAAHARGVRVDAWTIDGADEMSLLLDLGVDVIITSGPATLAEVLRRHATMSSTTEATPKSV
jgi:glycerophosphoryl diester phosphodiesterase